MIDYMGYGIAQGNVEELWIYHEIKSLYQANRITAFLDIGTNIGQTLIKVKSLDANIAYYGFEPNPNCVFYLNSLIKLNKLRNVAINCLGLGARRQMGEFHYAGLDDVCGTFRETNASLSRLPFTVSMPVWPLDEIQFSFTEGDGIIVKIDVEGFELEVLEGASNFVSRYKPIIIIEVLPHQHLSQSKARSASVFRLFRDWNYHAYRIRRLGEREEITDFPDNADNFDTVDYLFIPN